MQIKISRSCFKSTSKLFNPIGAFDIIEYMLYGYIIA